MPDPIERLALQRAIVDSAEIEAQLSIIKGTRPVLSLLVRARNEAAETLSALAHADPFDWKQITSLQTDVIRYEKLLLWFKAILVAGIEADTLITQADRDEFTDLLAPDEREEAMELGLPGVSHDDV